MQTPMDTYTDPQLGLVLLRPNRQARRFVFRVKEGRLVATVPWRATLSELRTSLDRLRPRLLQMLERGQEQAAARVITPEWRIETEHFRFHCEEAPVERMRVAERQGQLVCYYPPGQDFSAPDVQQWLTLMIEESLRRHARAQLLPRLGDMARRRGLRYERAAIHRTRGRWGSCSASRHIALSLYLLLLPPHLQELVMQHELTHLLEMNHSPRFHALLNDALGGREADYETELRRYETSIFCLSKLRQ